jgi:hypothetical protein
VEARDARAGKAGCFEWEAVKAQALNHGIVAWLALAMCGPMASRGSADIIKFEVSRGLDDFEFAKTGDGKSSEWSIVRRDAIQALAQTSTDTTDNHFPLAIYRRFWGRDVDISTRFMPVAGKVDQAGGIVIRLTSADDYYVVRANALEDNVRFYRVVGGRREMLASANTKVSSKVWHALGIVAKGDRFTVSFDGQELFTANDNTFTRAGKVGLWTKSDSVTWFESIEAKLLDP